MFSPSGWERYFSTSRAGKYVGVKNECPVCGAKPPRGMKNSRWRWQTMHLAIAHRAPRDVKVGD